LTEVDNIRVTTKIVQHTRVGGTSTSYKYKQFPIKVGWQTDQGVQQLGVEPLDMYSGALGSFSDAMLNLLNEFDLDANFDPSKVQITDLGDVAQVIGQSLLTQLLKTPNGSLDSWDFPSLLDTIGRSYLATQLGLAPDAFSSGDSLDEILQNIGRSTVE